MIIEVVENNRQRHLRWCPVYKGQWVRESLCLSLPDPFCPGASCQGHKGARGSKGRDREGVRPPGGTAGRLGEEACRPCCKGGCIPRGVLAQGRRVTYKKSSQARSKPINLAFSWH